MGVTEDAMNALAGGLNEKTETPRKPADRIQVLEEENARQKKEIELLKEKARAMEFFVDGYRSYVQDIAKHISKAGDGLDACMAWDNDSTKGFVDVDGEIHALDREYTSRWARGVYDGWEHAETKTGTDAGEDSTDPECVRDDKQYARFKEYRPLPEGALAESASAMDEPDDADENDTCGAGDEYQEQCNNDCLDCPYWEDYWDE